MADPVAMLACVAPQTMLVRRGVSVEARCAYAVNVGPRGETLQDQGCTVRTRL